MGNGTCFKGAGIEIKSERPANVLVYKENGEWKYTSSTAVYVNISGHNYDLKSTLELEKMK